MILDKPENHLTDQEFFTHIKFFNYIFKNTEIPDDEDTFEVSLITLAWDDHYKVFQRIFKTSQILDIGIEIEEIDDDIESIKKEVNKKPQKEQDKLNKIIKKIKSGKEINIEEVADISWVWVKVYERMKFYPVEDNTLTELKDVITLEINKYLDNFINNKLTIAKKNYYKFETQKRVLIRLIEEGKKISLYGNNFIISEQIDKDGVIETRPDFCLVQTVYALQKLGYLQVIDVWEDVKNPINSSYSDNFIRSISVNIVLAETFINEINSNYKKENPQNIFEAFDEKRGILKFAGQEIELAKKGKETDAVLLLSTLLKEETTDWKHNDEILADWGYHDEDRKEIPRNKVYFAGQKINNAVELKTKIADFIECNTSKARINPKYRKIDE